MDEEEMLNRLGAFAFYAAALAIAGLSLLSGNYLVMAASAACLLLSVVCLKAGHILNNALIRRTGIIAYHNDYKLSGTMLALTRPEEGMHKAISVAVLRSENAPGSSAESLRGILESLMEPFEFSIRVVPVDKRRIIDALDTRRRMKEIQLARMGTGKANAVEALRREIQVIDADISNIRKSGTAFDTMMRLTAVAMADSPIEAARQSARSLERICDAFAAGAKLEYEILKGDALLRFVRWNA